MVGTLLHTGAQPTPEALAQFPQLRDVFMEVAAIKRGAELMMMIKSRDKREEVVNDIIKQSGARSSRRKKE
jgi:hypothetical protein